MNIQTRIPWLAMPLAILLLISTSVIEAGDKARSILPANNDVAGTTARSGILSAALDTAGPEASFDGKRRYKLSAPSGDAAMVNTAVITVVEISAINSDVRVIDKEPVTPGLM